MRVGVVGAGPAGNYSAYKLAKNHDVEIFERNNNIGRPIQCTGILSDSFTSILKPRKEFLLNKVNKTRIYAPNQSYVEAKIKTNYVICRNKFDNYLAKLAKDRGAVYHLNHSYKAREKINHIISSKRLIRKKFDVLVGADGPNSQVAKAHNLFNNRNFIIAHQLEVEMENDNVVEFYPYVGCYAWIVPVSDSSVRIGVGAYKHTHSIFKKFISSKIKDHKNKIIENQSGVIPTYNPKVKTSSKNTYLIGDAATFVKATTGGGIIPSLKAASVLSKSINNDLNYEQEWRKKLHRNLHTHLILHKMMQKFNQDDWNRLIDTFSKKDMKDLLYSESRDKIAKMIPKIALHSPSLFKYIKYFPIEELTNL